MKKTACTFCKRRKIKCDQNQPCASCLKYKNPDCDYASSPPTKKRTKKNVLETELNELKSKIRKLEQSFDGSGLNESLERGLERGLGPFDQNSVLGPADFSVPARFSAPCGLPGNTPSWSHSELALSQKGPSEGFESPFNGTILPGVRGVPGALGIPSGPGILGLPLVSPAFSVGSGPDQRNSNVSYERYDPRQGTGSNGSSSNGTGSINGSSGPRNGSSGSRNGPSSSNGSGSSRSSNSDGESVSTDASSANDMDPDPSKFEAIGPDIWALLQGNDYDFSVYEGYNTAMALNETRRSIGPLSWKGLLVSDSASRLIWDQIHLKLKFKQEKLLCQQGDGPFDPQEIQGEAFKYGNYSINEAVRDGAMTLGLYLNNPVNEALGLVTKIEMALPIRNVIWKLIDIYFSTLYPCFPFLDEEDFRTEIARLIGSDRSNSKPIVKTRLTVDFAYLGTLLIVIRLSYLSLFSTITQINERAFKSDDPNPKVQEKKYILNNPVNVESFHIAQQCLRSYNLFNITEFPVFQLELFTYIYRVWGPEYGAEPDSHELNGLKSNLFHTAYSLGLTREPTKHATPLFQTDPKIDNLGRKCWSFLKIADMWDGYASGYPIISTAYNSDTDKPYFTMENSNLIDTQTEKSIVDSATSACSAASKWFSSFIIDILDVNKTHKVSKILNTLDLMEREYEKPNGIFSQFSECSKSPDNQGFSYLALFKLELETKFSSVSIYIHLFNNFERHGNVELQFYCLLKIFTTTFGVLLRIHDVIRQDYTYNFLIIPAIETIIHKNIVFIYSMLLRLRLNYMTLLSDNDRIDVYQKFERSLMKMLDIHGKLNEPISKRYFYSWYIHKCYSCSGYLYEECLKYENISHRQDQFKYPMFKDVKKVEKLTGILDEIIDGLSRSGFESSEHLQNVPSADTGDSSTPGVSNTDEVLDNDFGNGDLLEYESIDKLWTYLDNLRYPADDGLNLTVVNDILKEMDGKQ